MSPLTTGGLLAFIGLNFACLIWIALIVGDDGAVRISPVAWTPNVDASLIDGVQASQPVNGYSEILARPIFFRERRPYIAPPPPPPPPQSSPAPVFAPPPPAPITKPDLAVSGIALIGDAKQAFLASASDPNGIWVKEGEGFMGWQVRKITSASVTIEKAGQLFDLLLYQSVQQD